jgi:hypothetical protein
MADSQKPSGFEASRRPRRGGKAHIVFCPENPLFPNPPSQRTTPPVFGHCNVANYNPPNSRRRPPRFSGPDSAFLGFITSRIGGVRETRYNRTRSGLRFFKSFPGVFLGQYPPSPTRRVCRVPGGMSSAPGGIISSKKNYFQTGIRF